jgi:phospholipase/lecithinase/hemolysin
MYYNDSNLQMNSQLILCIKEHDSEKNINSIDTIMFIGWSYTDNVYYIRGKRQDISDKNFVPYAFKSENENNVYNFMEFVVGFKETSTIILYNFNNISEMECNDITYDFLEEHIDINYEIAGYDDVKVTRLEIVKCLKLLKNIF